jgi:hypothetical protein
MPRFSTEVAITRLGTIAPSGTNTEVLDLDGCEEASVVVSNTGVNALVLTNLERAPLTKYQADPTAVALFGGTLSAGTDGPMIELERLSTRYLRLTMTSVSGTTYQIEVRGN